MAPELQKHAIGNDRTVKAKFKRNKADVFSLGITLMQMYTLEELHTLNYEENNPKLMTMVQKLPLPWLSTLLNKMLQLSYRERPSFKNCMKMIPVGITDQRSTIHQTYVANQ